MLVACSADIKVQFRQLKRLRMHPSDQMVGTVQILALYKTFKLIFDFFSH